MNEGTNMKIELKDLIENMKKYNYNDYDIIKAIAWLKNINIRYMPCNNETYKYIEETSLATWLVINEILWKE